MGEAYGWGQEGRHVFDPVRLEQAAAELRQQNTGSELLDKLRAALLPAEAFGKISGGFEAYGRLRVLLEGLMQELGKVGIDFSDLASRTLAAADMARDVEYQTRAAAAHGRVPE